MLRADLVPGMLLGTLFIYAKKQPKAVRQYFFFFTQIHRGIIHIQSDSSIKVYHSLFFSVFTDMCNSQHKQFENCLSPPKGTPYSIVVTP